MQFRFALVVLAACGTDRVTRGEGSTDDPIELDGGVLDDALETVGDGGAPDVATTPDGPLTACEEATSHSDLTWIEQRVLATSCAMAGCHHGTSPSAGLRLDPGFARANLVDVAAHASGWVRVVPGSPSSSYLMVAIGATTGPLPDDGVMPLGDPALCTPITDAIGRWIAGGAQ